MTLFYDNQSSSSSKPVPIKTSRAQKIQILIFDHWKLILYGSVSTLILAFAILFSTLFFTLPAANCNENSETTKSYTTNAEVSTTVTTTNQITTSTAHRTAISSSATQMYSEPSSSSTSQSTVNFLESTSEISTTTIAPSDLSCQHGFTLVNNKCWKLVTSNQARPDADKMCNGYGGATLFSVKSEQDNKAMINFVKDQDIDFLWSGLLCRAGEPISCVWDIENGSTANYSNFADGFPNIVYGNCVYFITSGDEAGQWGNEQCGQALNFVCELPATFHEDGCKNNYEKSCYLRFDLNLTVPQAQNFCLEKCANLVSIHSANEVRFIMTIYDFIGEILIGALAPAQDFIYWLDGTPANYNNLKFFYNSTCVHMTVAPGMQNVGKWFTRFCTETGKFLCKRSIKNSCT